jgi:hypothetical protein
MLRSIQNNSQIKTEKTASPANKKQQADISSFKQGSVIKGKVLQKFSNGDFLVSSGGKELRAHSSVLLKAGKEYNFTVMSSAKDKLELKVLQTPNKVQVSVPNLVSSANSLGKKLTDSLTALIGSHSVKKLPAQIKTQLVKLHSLTDISMLKKDLPGIVKWVNKNVQGSGMFWEAKILKLLTGKKGMIPKDAADTDMKGILLKLLKSLEKNSEDQESTKVLTVKVKEALNFIEQEQITNINIMRQDIGWLVYLPFINDDDFLSSELFVEKEQDETLHFSLLLDMSFTGKMNIDVSLLKDTFGIHIDVEKEATKDFIMENAGELEAAFKKLGLKTGSINCEVKDEIVTEETIESGIDSSIDMTI